MKAYLNTKEHLQTQLENVLTDIQAIEMGITERPPDTSDQLRQLREIQHMYREISVSLKAGIKLYEV